jgi:hypothetical protein
MKVLIADDNPKPYYDGLIAVLKRERPNDEVVLSGDARDAYRKLKADADSPFDVLILDEKMGGGDRDGSALLRHLHSQPLPHQPAIIYVTGFMNEIPADQVAHSGTPVTIFLDKDSDSGTALFRALLLVSRQNEGLYCHPSHFFGERFVDLVTADVDRILETPLSCYLDLAQQRLIGSLLRSFFTTLRLRRNWTADDVLELAVFLSEGLCRVYNLPDDIVRLVRKFVDCEEVLYTIPRYRDHFLHQIKVFLLGFVLLNEINRRHRVDGQILGQSNAMKLWFLTALFHDLGYPFEKMKSWLNGFVLGVLRSPAEAGSQQPLVPVEFNWGVLFGRRYNWYHLERLADAICRLYSAEDSKTRAELLGGLGEFVAERPDHGLYSALIMQNFLRVRLDDSEVDPLAVAIALHNISVSRVVRRAVGGQLTFERDPLSFLLMFCDTAQEWGRAEFHLRDLKSFGPSYAVFDSLDWSCGGEVVSVNLRYGRRWNSKEVNEWKQGIFEKELLPLRDVWSSGPSSPLCFSISYSYGEDMAGRATLDILRL